MAEASRARHRSLSAERCGEAKDLQPKVESPEDHPSSRFRLTERRFTEWDLDGRARVSEEDVGIATEIDTWQAREDKLGVVFDRRGTKVIGSKLTGTARIPQRGLCKVRDLAKRFIVVRRPEKKRACAAYREVWAGGFSRLCSFARILCSERKLRAAECRRLDVDVVDAVDVCFAGARWEMRDFVRVILGNKESWPED